MHRVGEEPESRCRIGITAGRRRRRLSRQRSSNRGCCTRSHDAERPSRCIDDPVGQQDGETESADPDHRFCRRQSAGTAWGHDVHARSDVHTLTAYTSQGTGGSSECEHRGEHHHRDHQPGDAVTGECRRSQDTPPVCFTVGCWADWILLCSSWGITVPFYLCYTPREQGVNRIIPVTIP